MKQFIVLMLLMIGATVGVAADVDYWIESGYDFATGEEIQRKLDRHKATVIWEKRERGYSDFYQRYDLSHPEPLIVISLVQGYKFTYFDIYSNNRGWRFWNWSWYVCRDRLVTLRKATREDDWPWILRNWELSQSELRMMFDQSVALYRTGRADDVSAYQKTELARYYEAQGYEFYAVQPEEDIYSVAIRWAVSPFALRIINNLSDSELQPGQRLKIPKRDIVTTPTESFSREYKAKSGDDIYSVAIRFGVGPRDVMQLNNLSDSDLQPGQILKIPHPR